MKRSIHFSGPHGSGKSTLSQTLSDRHAWSENKSDIDFTTEFAGFDQLSDAQRSWLRVYHRIFMATSAERQANECGDCIIMTNRSVLDSLAYLLVYENMGRIGEDEALLQRRVIEDAGLLPNVVIVNPPLDILQGRLARRRADKSRENRDRLFAKEDTEAFLVALIAAYESMRQLPNVLYLADNSPYEQKLVLEWVQSNG